jgi:hypothetical protein
VLGEDAFGVVDRHRVAGELDHLGAEFDVQIVQRGALEVGGHRSCSPEGPHTTASQHGGLALAVRFT